MPSISRGDSLVSQIDIYLHFDRTFTELGGVVRTPPAPISVTQSDHVFTFAEYLAGETIEVVSDGTIVYTSVIGQDGMVVVPDDLTGYFTLVLYVGDKNCALHMNNGRLDSSINLVIYDNSNCKNYYCVI